MRSRQGQAELDEAAQFLGTGIWWTVWSVEDMWQQSHVHQQGCAHWTAKEDEDSLCLYLKKDKMIINRKRKQNHPPLHFMNNELQTRHSITLLRVTIAKSIAWSQHITGGTIKTAKCLYILGRTRNLLPYHHARVTIYKAYALSMEYASPIWNGAGSTSLKLQTSCIIKHSY